HLLPTSSPLFPYTTLFRSRRKAVLVLLFLGLVQAVGAYELTDNLSTAVIIMTISVVIIFLSHPKTRPFLLALVIITAVVGGILEIGSASCRGGVKMWVACV